MRHLALHIGVMAGIALVLVFLGVQLGTALVVGMVAGCAAMAFGGGHGASTFGAHGTGREPNGAPPRSRSTDRGA
jgi:hypothetical protein